jgi:DNA-binding NtrC family response regulator
LQETGGDKVAAARILGIGKTTLYRKLKHYESHPAAATPQ